MTPHQLWQDDLADSNTILIVDDKPDLLTTIQRNFSKYLDSVNVLVANSGQEALDILSRKSIDLIVADFIMPEMTGLDLLFRIRSQWPDIDIIIMTGHCTDELKETAGKNGCIQIFEKPFPMDEMRKTILTILNKNEKGFTGIIKRIHLSDLIQMCCLNGATESIRFRRGAREAYIHICKGEIIDAACEKHTGEEAFFRIMDWPEGSFETLTPMPGIQKSIFRGWQYLLMEGSRRTDETDEKKPDIAENLSQGPKPIRLMIVDDSVVMIRALKDIFSASERISVVGTAANGEEALKIIDELKPDIMTLDINMPVMSGGTALMHIMIKSPCPVVIVSSITNSRSKGQIMDFLRLGAVDFLNKPKNNELSEQKQEFINTICRAADAVTFNFKRFREVRERKSDRTNTPVDGVCKKVVIINSGPGGHADAIRLITSLPFLESTCCILLQPLPDEMVEIFANHMDRRCDMAVLPLHKGAPLLPGRCYIGPIHHAWRVENKGSNEWAICNHSDAKTEAEEKIFLLLRSIADKNELGLLTVLLSGAIVSDSGSVEELAKRGCNWISQKKSTMMVSDFIAGNMKALVEQVEPEEIIQTIANF